MPKRDPASALELRRLMHGVFRRYGALRGGETPCGKPLSMAHAHALIALLTVGDLSQQELGAELCIDKSNVARLCSRMVDAGHAKQVANPDDARSRRVSLTAAGKRLAQEVDEASRARFGAVLARLAPGRRAQVLASLEELNEAIASLPPQDATP